MNKKAVISKEEYKSFQQLENITGIEAYEKFGLKRDEMCHLDIKVKGTPYILHVGQFMPLDDKLETYACGTLENTETDYFMDCFESDDTILGEWYFYDNSIDKEIYINLVVE